MANYLPVTSLILISLLLSVGLASPSTANAQQNSSAPTEPPAEGTLLAYVDDAGRLHVVNSIEMIPQQFRARARPAKLGEVSTISSSSATPSSRSKTRKTTQRGDRQPAPAQQKQAPAPTNNRDRIDSGESTKQKLVRLREKRAEVIDQLGMLDEGWMEPDSTTEPSAADLEARSAALSKELEALDRAIAKLKTGR